MKSLFDNYNQEKAVSVTNSLILEKNEEQDNKVLHFLSILGSGDLSDFIPHLENGTFDLDFKIPIKSLPKSLRSKVTKVSESYFSYDNALLSLAAFFLISNRFDLFKKTKNGNELSSEEIINDIELQNLSYHNGIKGVSVLKTAFYYDNKEMFEFYENTFYHNKESHNKIMFEFFSFLKDDSEINKEKMHMDVYPKKIVHHMIDNYIIPFMDQETDKSQKASFRKILSQGTLEQRLIVHNDYDAFKKLVDKGFYKSKKVLRNVAAFFIPNEKYFCRLYQWYLLNLDECKSKVPILLDLFKEGYWGSSTSDFWKNVLDYKEINANFKKEAGKNKVALKCNISSDVDKFLILSDLDDTLIDYDFLRKNLSHVAKANRGGIHIDLMLLPYIAKRKPEILQDMSNIFALLKKDFENDFSWVFALDHITKWKNIFKEPAVQDFMKTNKINLSYHDEYFIEKYKILQEADPNIKIWNKKSVFMKIKKFEDSYSMRQETVSNNIYKLYVYLFEQELELFKELDTKIKLSDVVSKIINSSCLTNEYKIQIQKEMFDINLSLYNVKITEKSNQKKVL